MKGYREVKVKVEGKKVVCDPDPAQLYFQAGPDCIRWTFGGAPQRVASVVVEWKKDGSRPPLFAGMGFAPSSTGSHLPDIITRGNNQVPGRYAYSVLCFDAQGELVAEADPQAQNDPDPP